VADDPVRVAVHVESSPSHHGPTWRAPDAPPRHRRHGPGPRGADDGRSAVRFASKTLKWRDDDTPVVPAMNPFEIPAVRWAFGLLSATMIVAIGVLFFEGTERLAVFLVAAVALVGEPLVLGKAMRQQQ
jgi:hypothetical protein